jgi:hypothetical protein
MAFEQVIPTKEDRFFESCIGLCQDIVNQSDNELIVQKAKEILKEFEDEGTASGEIKQ